MVQRFGDLIRGQRSNPKRIAESFLTPTLDATPGDLSLVMPKRILDGIIEMIYALDNILLVLQTMTHFSMVSKLNFTTWRFRSTIILRLATKISL